MSAFTNTVQFHQPTPRVGYTPQQTQGAYNQAQAQAFSMGDPRLSLKALDKAGFSRGAGQQSYAAANAANQYANGMQNAEAIPIQDASQNANYNLQMQASRDQMAQQLAAYQERVRQMHAMHNISNQQHTLGILSGLLG